MALIKCAECSKEISDKATTCPHCGAPAVNSFAIAPNGKRIPLETAKPKKSSNLVIPIVIGFLILLPFALYEPSPSTSTPTPPPDPVAEARFQKTARMADGVKRMLRDPESVIWESIRSNDDASVICIEYRARNGFGGMAKEFAVYAKNNVSQEAKSWNKYCTKPLTDMSHVEYALK